MNTTRYTIDLDRSFDEKLTRLAESKNASKAEIIRRALATYSYISGQALKAPENNFSITDKNGRVVKDIVIP